MCHRMCRDPHEPETKDPFRGLSRTCQDAPVNLVPLPGSSPHGRFRIGMPESAAAVHVPRGERVRAGRINRERKGDQACRSAFARGARCSFASHSCSLRLSLTAPLYGSGGSSSSRNHVKVDLVNANGADVGFVKLTKQGDMVIVRGEVQGFTPGFHGFHVHSVGQCAAPFTSAGGHYNPGGVGHGSHAGDMPSLLVLDDGTAMAEFATDNFAIADLFDADGSAIIVHAAPDNFANIPDALPVDDRGCLRPRLGDARNRRRGRTRGLRRSSTRSH